MKRKLIYQKPCLRGMNFQDVAGLCKSGTAATGFQVIESQCYPGGVPDQTLEFPICQAGNGDSNNFLALCTDGQAVSGATACNNGTGPSFI